MEHIGEILRTAREDNFYTQKKVMELTGINRKTLSGYENSVAEPDLTHLPDYSAYINFLRMKY